MNKYRIQQKLNTMSHLYLFTEDTKPYFEFHGLKFFQWDFNCIEAHKGEHWLVEVYIEATDFIKAFSEFYKKFNLVVSQISLLTQCFTEHLNESYLIHKHDSDIAYLKYTKTSGGVPLSFDEDGLRALENLNNRQDINEAFYFYWNDMLNVRGYSAKLLLMCSALETLANSPINTGGRSDKYNFLSNILGEDLKDRIWKNNNLGIRHRLVHGDYFNEDIDKGEDYLKIAYEKVVEYFNTSVLGENLIRNVTNPQRHPDGNKSGGPFSLKRKSDSPEFRLKELVEGLDKNFDTYIRQFELLNKVPDKY